MSPKVSVLMCAYNSENTITQAVDSILNQTYRDFELIVVENGSTDLTWQILNRLSLIDSRIYLHRTNLKQLTFNLNYGLNVSKGEYVVRMDSDDISMPDRIEKLIAAIDDGENYSVVGSWYKHFGGDEKLIKLPLSHNDIFSTLPFRGAICHPSVIIRKVALLSVGGYEGLRYVEDIDLWLKLKNSGFKFKNIDLPLLKYRIHAEQSRGRKASYFSLAGLFLRESFLYRRPIYFFASLLALLKGVVRGVN